MSHDFSSTCPTIGARARALWMLDGFSRETCLERKSGFSVCRWNCRGLRPLSLSITAMIEKRSCRRHLHFDTTTISNSWSARHLFASCYAGFFSAAKPLSVPTPCSIDSQLSADARHELFETAFWENYPPAHQKKLQALAASLSTPKVMPCLWQHSCGCHCTKLGTVVAQVVDESILKCCHLLITSLDTLVKS